jgi:hypothetical protein
LILCGRNQTEKFNSSDLIDKSLHGTHARELRFSKLSFQDCSQKSMKLNKNAAAANGSGVFGDMRVPPKLDLY